MDQNFQIVLERYLAGELSAEERQQFFTMIAEDKDSERLEKFIDQVMKQGLFDLEEDSKLRMLIYDRLQHSIQTESIVGVDDGPEIIHEFDEKPIRHIPYYKKKWFRYAAGIVVMIGLGIAAYFIPPGKEPEKVISVTDKKSETNSQPGSGKAVLTLADGTTVIPDDAANGNLAKQGDAQIMKLADGQIAYHLNGSADGELMWNKMTTPRGCQYQLTLPDGTKVWLNAASSIKYPAAFKGSERNVIITGEAYFEVAKNETHPFKVKINDNTEVQVLGTNFNIHAYHDEPAIKATLLKGSIRVVKNHFSELIDPGEQAVIKDKIEIRTAVDTDNVTAWRKGIFEFRNADLPTVMRQISRWYDVDVVYKNPPSDLQLGGIMSKDLPLSDLLEILSGTGIDFKLKGKILEVYNK